MAMNPFNDMTLYVPPPNDHSLCSLIYKKDSRDQGFEGSSEMPGKIPYAREALNSEDTGNF
jgi:hypothetical protein